MRMSSYMEMFIKVHAISLCWNNYAMNLSQSCSVIRSCSKVKVVQLVSIKLTLQERSY